VFLERFARRETKNIHRINLKSLVLLEAHSWPGNLRKLQNVMERSVVLCDSEVLSVDERWLRSEDTFAGTRAVAASASTPDAITCFRGRRMERSNTRRRGARSHSTCTAFDALGGRRSERCGRPSRGQADDAPEPHAEARHPVSETPRLAASDLCGPRSSPSE
jgi:DNA-binding NtrC family response regulator